jgi:hypothetical protein
MDSVWDIAKDFALALLLLVMVGYALSTWVKLWSELRSASRRNLLFIITVIVGLILAAWWDAKHRH